MSIKEKKSVIVESATPLMKQYNEVKAKHPDALLLFRVGDFYETFGKDAVTTSSVLGIVLTRRHNGTASEVELAGFPYHSLESYLPRLVRAGHRVAVCDQLEDPKLTKKIVKRGVTEIVTPGVTFSDSVLESRKNNFLAVLHFGQAEIGLALVDISTGEFITAQGGADYIGKVLHNFRPSEVIVQRNRKTELKSLNTENIFTYDLDDWAFSEENARIKLSKLFGTVSLKGFGIDDMVEGIVAAGAAIEYLALTRNDKLQHLTGIRRLRQDGHLWIDKFTVRNLELFESQSPGGKALIDILDHCNSPMGSRMMRRWLLWPLADIEGITKRQSAVRALIDKAEAAEKIQIEMGRLGDLERLISKVAAGKVNPRELNQLRLALLSVATISEIMAETSDETMTSLLGQLDPCPDYAKKILTELNEDAPVQLLKGQVIRAGVNYSLDELRTLQTEGKTYLLELQRREMERTGITSLKVAYNSVFGYYIEVRNTHRDKVPAEWTRKQTLVNAERYVTEELKEYEEKILSATENISRLESELFSQLVEASIPYIDKIQKNAKILAEIDCYLSFATIAQRFNYIQPTVDNSLTIDIRDGRHPVIEQNLAFGDTYVSNDVYLDCESQQILMITGPNMAGKSALLRQTALITLLAHMGSFVPASKARVGLVDRIFTRVGAGDNISQGESTFMVEMNETASILNNISERSLILLDEIGRGTSTFDGISIAWSVAEYLHENGRFRPKTLFATHYHELNEMTSLHPRIKNFNVSVKELENGVIFMRKLKPGGSEHSFGIHVARMAGMPSSIVERAGEILKRLEITHVRSNDKMIKGNEHDLQLAFFNLDDPTLEQIREELLKVDIDNLSPVQALVKLHEIKKLVRGRN